MRHGSPKWLNGISLALTSRISVRTRRSAAVIAMLISAVALAAASRAYNREIKSVRPETLLTASPPAQAPKARLFLTRLSFQPEANKMRRRLGQRFVVPGREVTVATGLLTIGADRQPIRIVRAQDDEQGEQVSITIGVNPASFSWSPKTGAVSYGSPLTDDERTTIERIALDSPDQFVLAQTRGASYYTAAHTVTASEAGDSEGSVPSWDLIRIGEPQSGRFNKPGSIWRIYYVNNATGLIDRIFYQEQGEDMAVALAGWASRAGELAPSQIRWTRGKSIVMELSLATITYVSR